MGGHWGLPGREEASAAILGMACQACRGFQKAGLAGSSRRPSLWSPRCASSHGQEGQVLLYCISCSFQLPGYSTPANRDADMHDV